VVHDLLTGTTSVELSSSERFAIGPRRFETVEREEYRTSELDPARSSFLGEETHHLALPGRHLTLRTRIEVISDSAVFRVTVTRRLYLDQRLVRSRRWQDSIPRDFH
jgi:hypothetical protein